MRSHSPLRALKREVVRRNLFVQISYPKPTADRRSRDVPGWKRLVPLALEKPRARLYAAGHAVPVLGGWLQPVAVSWLAL